MKCGVPHGSPHSGCVTIAWVQQADWAPTGSGNAALVRHLLKAKAEPSAGEDKLGRSPLSIAILANQKDARLCIPTISNVFHGSKRLICLDFQIGL